MKESETLLTQGNVSPAPAPPSTEPKRSQPLRASLARRGRWLQRFPLLLVLIYYAFLLGVFIALVTYVPAVRQALIEPTATAGIANDVNTLVGQPAKGVQAPTYSPVLAGSLHRAITTLLVIFGALALVVPVAWVYMRVKRFQYDPALVRSVIILPIVVAGITIVVKGSLALAFSLAGIVAAVRFRNTLKDPRDAVYIFLVIGIGLSAGVQALDVALVMSLAFNLVVLALWRYNIGSIYSGEYARTGVLSTGDPTVLIATSPESHRRIRKHLLAEAREIKADGILLVHSTDPDVARQTVQEALAEMGRDWQLVDIVDGNGVSTLEYVLRLRRRVAPPELIGALDERWAARVSAVEYVPFRKRKRRRKRNAGAITSDDEQER